MESPDRLQAARFEFKYCICEQIAMEVRQFTETYLYPDSYTHGKEGIGYAVHSLYLDSPDLMTCQAVMHGDKNRFKLRLRFYDDDPRHPVFFEIKRRANLVILKQRAAVKRSRVDRLVAGEPPLHEDLATDDYKNYKALLDFCALRDSINARPTAYTSYYREGYEPLDNNAARVTFDRQLRAGEYRGQLTVADLEQWACPSMEEGVVLELKFTDRFPTWMHDMVQWFDLTRGSFPKYVKCVSLLNGMAVH